MIICIYEWRKTVYVFLTGVLREVQAAPPVAVAGPLHVKAVLLVLVDVVGTEPPGAMPDTLATQLPCI